jgi:hypothetical protein
VRLAARGHPAPAAVQALLGAPGALEHEWVLAALARSECRADAGALALMPRGLDEQPADVSVTGLRDRALAARLPDEHSDWTSPT